MDVLACIGSHTQATGLPLAVTASTSGGSTSAIRPAPIRVIRVRRPGSRSGSRASARARMSCAVVAGPTFTASGLRMERGEGGGRRGGVGGAFADPQQMGGEVVALPGPGVRADEGPLVVQQQRLVAG